MFSLLPEREKKQIMQEYRFRVAVVYLTFFSILGISALVLLFPSYLLSSVKNNELNRHIESVRNPEAESESKTLSATVSEISAKMAVLAPKEKEVFVNTILQKVGAVKGDKVRLSSIAFRKKSPVSEVALEGIAYDRDSLSGFINSLRSESVFSKVEAPVSNFAKDRNLKFSILITIQDQK